MKRLVELSLFLLITALASSCATGQKAKPAPVRGETIPLAGSVQVVRHTLDNGLKLLVVEDHASPTVAYQTWFRVGSRNEVPGYTGLAHLFEHMMFKETKNLKDGEFDRLLEQAGAEGENAFTSRDYTAYIEEIPKEKLGLVARLEADRMVNLIVNEKAFKTEREVVQNERRFRVQNNPDGQMYQELFLTAFTKHPYHWPVIGTEEDLNRMSANDALEFYKKFYAPNFATIIVAGDVQADEVLALIQQYYGGLPAQPVATQNIEAEPPQTAPRKKQLKLNVEVEKILMAFHIPVVTSGELAPLDLAQAILTGGKSSRLHRALVETGIATGVGAYDFEDRDPSLMIIMASMQKGRKSTEAEAVVLKELQRLAREPVSEEELTRAKNRLSFRFYEGLNSNSERANFLGHYESVASDFMVGLAQFQRIQAATPADIQAAAKRYLDPSGRTVITGVRK